MHCNTSVYDFCVLVDRVGVCTYNCFYSRKNIVFQQNHEKTTATTATVQSNTRPLNVFLKIPNEGLLFFYRI